MQKEIRLTSETHSRCLNLYDHGSPLGLTQQRRATDPRSVPPGLELGKIEVQVYRGTRIKPGNTSKLVDYKEPRWLSCVKAEVSCCVYFR